MPTLQKVRAAAVRTSCLSNQRQLVTGVVQYQTMFRGKLPCGVHRGSVSASYQIRAHWADVISMKNDPGYNGLGRPAQVDGWTHLGWLFLRNIIKDARVYYCPASTTVRYEDYIPSYTSDKNGRIDTSYNYRFAFAEWPVGRPDFAGLPRISELGYPGAATDYAEECKIHAAAWAGKVRGVKAITADRFGYPDGWKAHWSHTRPYGIIVGYTDGHCDFRPLLEKDWKVISPNTFSLGVADQYVCMYFRAFDDGDFNKVRKAFGVQ
jgi:hypothetical protein